MNGFVSYPDGIEPEGWEPGEPPAGRFDEAAPKAPHKPEPLPCIQAKELGDLMKPPKLRWFLGDNRTDKPFLRAGEWTVVSGNGGIGKGFLTLQLAVATILQEPLFGTFPVETPGPVAMLVAEDKLLELHVRLSRILATLMPDADTVELIGERLTIFPLSGRQVSLLALDREKNPFRTAAFDQLKNQLGELASKGGFEWSLLTLDPLARFAGQGVETDQGAATAFVAALEALSDALPGKPSGLCTAANQSQRANDSREKAREVHSHVPSLDVSRFNRRGARLFMSDGSQMNSMADRRPGKHRRNRENRAAAVALAEMAGDDAAAAEYSVSPRTIRQWRTDAEQGKAPEVAQALVELRRKAQARSEDLLTVVLDEGLKELRRRLPGLDDATLIKAIDMIADKRITRDYLGDGADPAASLGTSAPEREREPATAKAAGQPTTVPAQASTYTPPSRAYERHVRPR